MNYKGGEKLSRQETPIDFKKYNKDDEVIETKTRCKHCDTEIVKIMKEYKGTKSLGSYKEVGTTVSHYQMVGQGQFECTKTGKSLGNSKSSGSSLEQRFKDLESRVKALEANNSDF